MNYNLLASPNNEIVLIDCKLGDSLKCCLSRFEANLPPGSYVLNSYLDEVCCVELPEWATRQSEVLIVTETIELLTND
jgi:hypothetical protein